MDISYETWDTESGYGRSFVTFDDEKGVATTSVYDAYGRMRYVIAEGNALVTYACDGLHRLKTFSPAAPTTGRTPATTTETSSMS